MTKKKAKELKCKQLCVRFRPNVYNRVKEMSGKEDVSMALIINRIVEGYFKENG